MKKIKIAVYGSLRRGCYNYNAFKNIFQDDFEYIKTTTIAGYQIFDLGSYPGLKISHDNAIVIVDIIECSEECFRSIERMELGANYSTIVVTDSNNSDDAYKAFLYNGNCTKLVENGDWVKYLKISDNEN